MKRKLSKFNITSIVIIFFAFLGCNNIKKSTVPDSEVLYQCPMDTQIVSKTQDKCPICKMKLELKIDASIQSISPSIQVVSSQKTITISPENYSNQEILTGITSFATNLNKTVPAKFGGRIEKLYIKYNFKYVNAGDKVMEIYNPELMNMQEEYLFLLKNKNNNELLEKSRMKLLLSGINETQILELEKSFKIKKTITIYSPYSGFVIFNYDLFQNSTNSSSKPENNPLMNMNSGNISESNYENSTILEGSYISNRTTLFMVNDLSEVWVWLSVPQNFIAELYQEMPIEISYDNKSYIKSKISLIEKNTDILQNKFSRIRVSIANLDNKILINKTVNANIKAEGNGKILIPRKAVYFTGNSAVVWLKKGILKNGNSIFNIQRIISGKVMKDKVEVLSGLNIGEKIAENAGMLTDSETILN